MKKLIVNIALISTLYGGGDILPIEHEVEEVIVPIEPYVAPTPPPVSTTPPPTLVPATPIPLPPPLVLKEIVPLGLYVGLGLTAAIYNPDCACPSPMGDSDITGGMAAKVGYDFNEYVGVEGRGIQTNWKSDGGKVKHAGLFVKPMYPVSEEVNLYGLAGYAKTTTHGSKRVVNAQTFAWGAGLEYDLGSDNPKEGKYGRAFDGYGDQEAGWGLFADYERLVQQSGSPDLDTLTIGVTYDF